MDLTEAKSRRVHIAQPGLSPCMVHRHQEDDVVGESKRVDEECSDLAPRGIGDDPVVMALMLKEIVPALEFTPLGAGWQTVKNVAIARAGLENAAGWREVRNELTSEGRWRLDVVVGNIVAIGLVAHTKLQSLCDE